MAPVSTTVNVSGMTCGHCVSSVSEELESLAGVEKVDVDLNAGGISTVTITSSRSTVLLRNRRGSRRSRLPGRRQRSLSTTAGRAQTPERQRTTNGKGSAVSSEQLLDQAGSRVIDLDIEGMTCASCVNRVETQARKARRRRGHRQPAPGVRPGHVPADITDDQITATVAAAGYKATVRSARYPGTPAEDAGLPAGDRIVPAGAPHPRSARA